MTTQESKPGGESGASVLVAVVNDPADLQRAREQGWYRIPLARAPSRIAAEYLAFYQTGAFPEDDRWLVRWYAPVTDYAIMRRRDLLPDEPDHPRADARYYRVGIGPCLALPCPIPSRRLRRITFIPTTLDRLLAAREINDLWIRTGTAERLWQAFQQAGLDAEYNFEIAEAEAPYVLNFVLPCREGTVAIEFEMAKHITSWLHEKHSVYPVSIPENWTQLRIPASIGPEELDEYLAHIKSIAEALGGAT